MPRGVYPRKPKVELPSLENLPPEARRSREEAHELLLAQIQGMAQSCARCHYFDVGSDPRYGACLRFPEPVPTRADRTKCGEFKG